MDIGGVDLAAMSYQMKSADVQQQVDVAVLKKGMDAQTEIAQMLIAQIGDVSAASGHVDMGA